MYAALLPRYAPVMYGGQKPQKSGGHVLMRAKAAGRGQWSRNAGSVPSFRVFGVVID
jgi:hypothetical protein